MNKSVIAGFACLMSAAAFAGANNVLVSFSTVGPDRYADDTLVKDGECYALVWTPSGETFQGIGADGKALGGSEVVIAEPLAVGHRCPNVTFQVTEEYAEKHYKGGTWGVYLLDTRRFATGEDGTILTDSQGNRVFDKLDKSVVNGYVRVAELSSTSMAGVSADEGLKVVTTSASPASSGNLKITKISIDGDMVHLEVSGSLPCLQYGLAAGDAPNALKTTEGAKYGKEKADEVMHFYTPKTAGSQFFQIKRK